VLTIRSYAVTFRTSAVCCTECICAYFDSCSKCHLFPYICYLTLTGWSFWWTRTVLCEVGAAVLCSLDECCSCRCAVAQVVSCQPLAMEALVLFQPVHMRVVIDKVALGQVFLQELKVLPVTSIIPLVLHSSS
jgi:hypothetical protein